MKKNNDLKVIAVSLFTLFACVLVGVGSTYAYFAEENKNSIVIEAADVDLKAEVNIKQLYSPTSLNSDGSVNVATNVADNTNHTFKNGGTVVLKTGGDIEISKISPGDYVTFEVKLTNNSTIDINYKVNLEETNNTTINSDNYIDSSLKEGESDVTLNTYSLWEYNPSNKTKTLTLKLGLDGKIEDQDKSNISLKLSIDAIQGDRTSTL